MFDPGGVREWSHPLGDLGGRKEKATHQLCNGDLFVPAYKHKSAGCAGNRKQSFLIPQSPEATRTGPGQINWRMWGISQDMVLFRSACWDRLTTRTRSLHII